MKPLPRNDLIPIPWVHATRSAAHGGILHGHHGRTSLVISRLLNHKEGGITQIYNRYSYDMEKREAMDRWADQITEMAGGSR